MSYGMRTVRHTNEKEYVLLKRSEGASLVRDVITGETLTLQNEELTIVEGASPLATLAQAVPESIRRVLVGVHSETALGLLVYLDDVGPTSIRQLIGTVDACESDLNGLFGELSAAGLLEETSVYGEPGYKVSDLGSEALAILQQDT